MKYKIELLFLFLLLVSFTSCDILEDDNLTIDPLDNRINFKVLEFYNGYETESIPEIFIEMQTEKEYPCMNYGLKANYRIDDRKIFIEIFGISKPDVCLTAFGPAYKQIKLGHITGIYEIEISGDNFNDKYNLLISDTLIILDGKETPDTKPLIYFLHRYPKNSFACIYNNSPLDSSIYEGFIDTLKNVNNITEFTFSDFAEIPYPETDKYRNVRYFYYENEQEFDKIEAVMKNYKQAHFPNDEVYLWILNWMNKRIYSWLL